MFPNDESKYNKAETDKWTWIFTSSRRRSCTRPASRRLADGPDLRRGRLGRGLFNAYGVVFIDAKDNIKINSDQTRQAMEIARKLMEASPAGSVRLGRRRQ